MAVIWKMTLPPKTKAAVAGLMSMGLLATGFGVARATSLGEKTNDLSCMSLLHTLLFSYIFSPVLTQHRLAGSYAFVALWSNLELWLGIIAANLALTRSIWRFLCHGRKWDDPENLGRRRRGRGGGGLEGGGGGDGGDDSYVLSPTTTIGGGSNGSRGRSNNRRQGGGGGGGTRNNTRKGRSRGGASSTGKKKEGWLATTGARKGVSPSLLFTAVDLDKGGGNHNDDRDVVESGDNHDNVKHDKVFNNRGRDRKGSLIIIRQTISQGSDGSQVPLRQHQQIVGGRGRPRAGSRLITMESIITEDGDGDGSIQVLTSQESGGVGDNTSRRIPPPSSHPGLSNS